MRYRRSISWILTLSAAALLGGWASRAFLSMEQPTVPSVESAEPVACAPDVEACASPPGIVDFGELIPGPEARLQEQIKTLHLGVAASVDDNRHDAPGPKPSPDAEPADHQSAAGVAAPADLAGVQFPSWFGWAVLAGGSLMVAIPSAWMVAVRRRKAAPPLRPVPAEGAVVAEDVVLRAEFEAAMRGVQESILEVVQLVEAIHRRIEKTPDEPEAAAEDAGGWNPDEPEARGPWADRDLSMPAPATADGRDLTAVRRAVLRLAEQGWGGERIADRLRLGRGDVGLILKSGGSPAKAGERMTAGAGRN